MGLSEYDPQPERYTPLIYAGDVLQLLAELKVDRAVFVGTSLGGLVTMAIAAMAPQHIAAAILNDVGPDVAPGGVDRILTYVGRTAASRAGTRRRPRRKPDEVRFQHYATRIG